LLVCRSAYKMAVCDNGFPLTVAQPRVECHQLERLLNFEEGLCPTKLGSIRDHQSPPLVALSYSKFWLPCCVQTGTSALEAPSHATADEAEASRLHSHPVSGLQTCDRHLYSYTIRACGPGQLSQYSHSLRAGRYRYRIPVGARFSAPIQNQHAVR
jgi:hypothetical protein